MNENPLHGMWANWTYLLYRRGREKLPRPDGPVKYWLWVKGDRIKFNIKLLWKGKNKSDPFSWTPFLEGMRSFYLGARLDKELFPLLLMEPLRRRLRKTLVQTYFGPEVCEILIEHFQEGGQVL